MSSLLAVSDLHVAYTENRGLVERLRPRSEDDWLLVAGDVAERVTDFEWALGHLHVPRTTWHDGVRVEEVSLGYPREWRARTATPELPRAILEEGLKPTAAR